MNPNSYKISQIITISPTGETETHLNKLGCLIRDSTGFGTASVVTLLDMAQSLGHTPTREIHGESIDNYVSYYITIPATLEVLEFYCKKVCSREYSKKELATMKGIIAKINEFMESK